GTDHAERWLALLHHPHLHRRSMGTQYSAGSNIEGVVHGTRRVMIGNIEGAEVVVVVLDLGTDRHLVACRFKDSLDSVDGAAHRMGTAGALAATGQRDIHRLGLQLPVQR